MTNSVHDQVSKLIDNSPVSGLQRTVFVLCFLIVAIDGFDTTVIGFLAPAIIEEWAVPPAEFGSVFGMGIVGAVIGALVFGPVGDRIGRKATLIITTVLFSVACIISGWVQNIDQLLLMRFISGLGLGGALPCATALTTEYSPRGRRSSLVTTMFCGFALGAVLGGLIAGLTISTLGWRGILIIGGVAPLFLVPVLWRFLPESVGFLLYQGRRFQKVKDILFRIAPDEPLDFITPVSSTGSVRKPGNRVGDLFRVRPLFGTLILWVASYMVLLSIGLLSSWMPTLLSGKGYTLETASFVTLGLHAASVIGGVVIGRIMDKFHANRVLAYALFGAAISLAAIVMAGHSILLVSIALFMTGLGLSGNLGMWSYVANYYPVYVRVTGVSWTSACGRAGSITGSFLGGWLLALGMSMEQIMEVLAGPIALAAVLLFVHGRYNAMAIDSRASESTNDTVGS